MTLVSSLMHPSLTPEQRLRNLLLERIEQIDDASLRPTIPPFIEAPDERRRDMDALIWAELERLGYGEVVAIRKKYG